MCSNSPAIRNLYLQVSLIQLEVRDAFNKEQYVKSKLLNLKREYERLLNTPDIENDEQSIELMNECDIILRQSKEYLEKEKFNTENQNGLEKQVFLQGIEKMRANNGKLHDRDNGIYKSEFEDDDDDNIPSNLKDESFCLKLRESIWKHLGAVFSQVEDEPGMTSTRDFHNLLREQLEFNFSKSCLHRRAPEIIDFILELLVTKHQDIIKDAIYHLNMIIKSVFKIRGDLSCFSYDWVKKNCIADWYSHLPPNDLDREEEAISRMEGCLTVVEAFYEQDLIDENLVLEVLVDFITSTNRMHDQLNLFAQLFQHVGRNIFLEIGKDFFSEEHSKYRKIFHQLEILEDSEELSEKDRKIVKILFEAMKNGWKTDHLNK